MEAVLTFGLVSVILGTASGAQNLGVFGALGVGAYIILAGLWGSPISGASMNPARTFGPDLVGGDFTSYWVYVAGPLIGACLAVGAAFACADPAAAGPDPAPPRATSRPRSNTPTRRSPSRCGRRNPVGSMLARSAIGELCRGRAWAAWSCSWSRSGGAAASM